MWTAGIKICEVVFRKWDLETTIFNQLKWPRTIIMQKICVCILCPRGAVPHSTPELLTKIEASGAKNPQQFPCFLGFSHKWGYPIAGWFISWKITSKNGCKGVITSISGVLPFPARVHLQADVLMHIAMTEMAAQKLKISGVDLPRSTWAIFTSFVTLGFLKKQHGSPRQGKSDKGCT